MSNPVLNVLRQHIGQHLVFGPDDTEFVPYSSAWNQAIKNQPIAVVAATAIEHIERTVQVCNSLDIPIGVKNTQHGGKGITRGVLLDVHRLNNITFYPGKTPMVTAQCGAYAGQLIDLLEKQQLMVPPGSSYNIGLSGLVSGGGIGWMANPYGPLCRYVKSFTVVLSDGQRHHVSAHHYPDLFKSQCGGGANAAIIVDIQFADLLPVTPILCGHISLSHQYHPADVVEWYRDWVDTLPNSATTSIAFVRESETDSHVEIRACFVGDLSLAAHHLDYWSEYNFIEHTFGPKLIQQIWDVSRDTQNPIPVCIVGGDVLKDLEARTIAYYANHSVFAQLLSFVEFRDIGRMPQGREDQSFTLGEAAKYVWMAAGLAPDEQQFKRVAAYGNEFREALPDRTGVPYLNFLEMDEMERCLQLPRESVDLHRQVKERYDPLDRLQFNYPYSRNRMN